MSWRSDRIAEEKWARRSNRWRVVREETWSCTGRMVNRDVIAGVHGRGMAAVWLLYGCCMAAVWLMYGCSMAAVWLLHGCCMSAVFLFDAHFSNAHRGHDSNEAFVYMYTYMHVHMWIILGMRFTSA